MAETGDITHVLELDLYTTTSYPVIKAQQYDTESRYLRVILKDHEEPYTIPTGAVIYLEGVRASDALDLQSTFQIKGEIDPDFSDVVVFDISQAITRAGVVEAKVRIMWDKNVLSSISLYFDVERLSTADIQPTTEEISILDMIQRNLSDHITNIPIHRSILYNSTEPEQSEGDIWMQEY